MLTYLLYLCLCVPSNQVVQTDLELIRQQLTQTLIQSLELRSQVMPLIEQYGVGSAQMDSLDQVMRQQDSVALILVTDIIDQYGWLGISKIGTTANQALFLTIQHAPDKSIREKYFPLLMVSASQGESSNADMATMLDRMLVENGQPQLYGTQSRMVDGQLTLYPVEKPQELGKRRKKVGLPKL